MFTAIHPGTDSPIFSRVRLPIMFRSATAACLVLAAASLALLWGAAPAAAQTEETLTQAPPPSALLDTGFRKLYELNFKGARADFVSYENLQQDDPLGTAAEAASYLYEEFNDKGVFTSSFFLNDAKFLNGAAGNPTENRNDAFLQANRRARDMAAKQLKAKPRDPHSLLVLTMTDGMESDYDALIVKKQMAGLGLMKQADAEAATLLAVDPTAQDANLALGAANYIIGCLPSYKRAFLWFGGVHGDRERGLAEMQLAAEQGHYLKPFAKIFLALAFEREHQPERARALLADLATEFPANPLFEHELALVTHAPAPNPQATR
jgi:hypothetical protein